MGHDRPRSGTVSLSATPTGLYVALQYSCATCLSIFGTVERREWIALYHGAALLDRHWTVEATCSRCQKQSCRTVVATFQSVKRRVSDSQVTSKGTGEELGLLQGGEAVQKAHTYR
jgi:hypothetical protein